MSEHTPDTSNGLADGPEPSMEDILASIRKIIADDEDNMPALDMANELSSDIETASDVSKSVEVMDLDIVSDEAPSDEEIDLLIADMDMLEAETLEASSKEDVLELSVDNAMELDIPEQEDISSLTEDISTAPEATLVNESGLEAEDTSDDDLSAMLDDMMNSDISDYSTDLDEIEKLTDEIETPELASESLEDIVSELDDLEDTIDDDLALESELNADSLEGDADMALVKSLMADLTGAPLHDDTSLEGDAGTEIKTEIEDDAETDVNAELEANIETVVEDEEDIFESLETALDDTLDDDTVDEAAESPALDALKVDIDDTDTSDDVMDEILSLTLDDEMDIQDEELEASGVDVPLSLKDIAAQAEAEADAIDGGPAIAMVAVGATALGVAANQSDETSEADLDDLELPLEEPAKSDDVDDILSMLDTAEDTPEESEETEASTDIDIPVEADVETDTQIDTHIPDPITEETPEMPRAAKKDAIIGEVTESATADVFSSLNKVVEEKAVVAERGDRIGDLVTDALRPMLKEWLDENLKGIVERAVTKEVKRISSGK